MSKFDFTLPGLGRAPSSRPQKVAEAIKNELAIVLLQKVRDPRLRDVCITTVEMTSDLKLAKVYFDIPEKTNKRDVENGLKKAKGFFRSSIARALNLRYTPDLIFRRDTEHESIERLENLLEEIAHEDKNDDQ